MHRPIRGFAMIAGDVLVPIELTGETEWKSSDEVVKVGVVTPDGIEFMVPATNVFVAFHQITGVKF